jgi:hypothetical protein
MEFSASWKAAQVWLPSNQEGWEGLE